MYIPEIQSACLNIQEAESNVTAARVEFEDEENVEWKWVLRDLTDAKNQIESAIAKIERYIPSNTEV